MLIELIFALALLAAVAAGYGLFEAGRRYQQRIHCRNMALCDRLDRESAAFER